MKEFYDVIINGAGPAGLSCARELAGSSLSVLIIDKSKTLATKACGGGITQLAGNFGLPKDKIRIFDKQTVFLNRLKCIFYMLAIHKMKHI